MKWVLILTSSLGHIAAVVGLDQIEPATVASVAVPITFEEAPPVEPEPASEPEPPPEPPLDSIIPEKDVAPPAAAPSSASPQAAQSPDAPSTPSLDSVQELGLELGGVSGGMSVPSGTGARGPSQPAPTARRTLAAGPKLGVPADAKCSDAGAKPRLTHLPQPAYTDAARAAGVSGKVRISITVGVSGQVEQASVLQALGHGLDEAALAAARAATFEPAIRCGKPSASTFTISVRFSAN